MANADDGPPKERTPWICYRSGTTLDRALLITTAETVGLALVMSYVVHLRMMLLG